MFFIIILFIISYFDIKYYKIPNAFIFMTISYDIFIKICCQNYNFLYVFINFFLIFIFNYVIYLTLKNLLKVKISAGDIKLFILTFEIVGFDKGLYVILLSLLFSLASLLLKAHKVPMGFSVLLGYIVFNYYNGVKV